MNLLVFDLRGPLGHFRRPDTLVTHATYPFIPRTALHGLCAAVLGLEQWPDPSASDTTDERRPWCGLRILKPIRTVTHQISYLGKGWTGDQAGGMFNRPTTVELVVEPHYRIYYTGPLVADLAAAIRDKRGVWHTYLGAAFCLTFPEYVREYNAVDWTWRTCEQGTTLECSCIVPTAVVGGLVLPPGKAAAYARAGGFVHCCRGGRKFSGLLSFVYDPNGGGVRFRCAGPSTHVRFASLRSSATEEEVLVLW